MIGGFKAPLWNPAPQS